jgi:hypothetical protein
MKKEPRVISSWPSSADISYASKREIVSYEKREELALEKEKKPKEVRTLPLYPQNEKA